MTTIRLVSSEETPVLTVAIALPVGFDALPLEDRRREVEVQLARANETTQRMIDRGTLTLAGA